MQDIELARISQEVAERFYNLVAVGEGGRCPSRVMGGKTLSEYMFSEYPLIADIVGAPIANLKISLRRSDPRCCSSSEIALVPGIVPIGSRSAAHCAYGDCIRPKLRCRGWRRGVLPRAMWRSASSAPR